MKKLNNFGKVLWLAAVMAADIGLAGCDSPANPGSPGGQGQEQEINETVIPKWTQDMTDAGKTDLHGVNNGGINSGNGDLTSSYKTSQYGVIEAGLIYLFKGLAKQSKTLHDWADGVTIYPADDSAQAKFDAIVAAQAGINGHITGVNGSEGNKLADLPGKMDTEIETMLQEIFGNASEQLPTPNSEEENPRDKFERYFAVYKQAMYLANRDWSTVNGTNLQALTDAQSAYSAAITVLRNLDGTEDAIKSMNIGTRAPYANQTIEDHAGLHGYGSLENALAGQIADALGMGTDANVIAAAKKLVIQIGQDAEELRTLADDLTACAALKQAGSGQGYNTNVNYAAALEYNWVENENLNNDEYKITQAEQIETQSNVKLAGINARFSNGAVKTAHGKPFEQYTGGFTPYTPRKDGTEITV